MCNNLVPIHCSTCKFCNNYEFLLNHKPKKLKEILTGYSVYMNPLISDDLNTITLDEIRIFCKAEKS
jgi:hypothetical protein